MARVGDGVATTRVLTSGTSKDVSTALTFSAWFMVTDAGGVGHYGTIIVDSDTDTSSGIWIVNSGGNRRMAWYLAGSLNKIDPGSTAISLNTWYHVAMSAPGGGGTVKTYINNVSDGTFSQIAGSAIHTGFETINDAGGFDPIIGSVADVAYWNVALTPLEIQGLASGMRPYRIRKPNLKLWWPLDGDFSTEPDLSGAAINGTVTGATKGFGPPFALQNMSRLRSQWHLPPDFVLMPQIVT
jgi:Concanavalin A-like lectin/glucanases superfamily